jgi:hypothetical protein
MTIGARARFASRDGDPVRVPAVFLSTPVAVGPHRREEGIRRGALANVPVTAVAP